MFETLFTYPVVLRRHREGPLAIELAAYLSELTAHGIARGTILRRSRDEGRGAGNMRSHRVGPCAQARAELAC